MNIKKEIEMFLDGMIDWIVFIVGIVSAVMISKTIRLLYNTYSSTGLINSNNLLMFLIDILLVALFIISYRYRVKKDKDDKINNPKRDL